MGIREILYDFYKHATGIDDYGCEHCKQTEKDLKALIPSEKEIDNIIMNYFGFKDFSIYNKHIGIDLAQAIRNLIKDKLNG